MDNKNRQNEIMDILHDQGYATVEELAERIHISASSIRRDLTLLEAKGMIQRSYGGAELLLSDNVNLPFKIRMAENRLKKKRIAEIALSLVRNGSVIFCSGGSTVHYLVKLLASVKSITVVTNGVEALSTLSASQAKAISTGGIVNPENRAALVGDTALRSWESMRGDIAFFSSQALDKDGNIFDNYEAEIAGVRAMLKSSACRVLLCDSTKVGKTSTFLEGTLADVDIVISDKDISKTYKKKFPSVKFISDII